MKCPECGATDDKICKEDCDTCGGFGFCQGCEGEGENDCPDCEGGGGCSECDATGSIADSMECISCKYVGEISEFEASE